MESLIAACTAFVGFHFLLSHPLRGPLVKALGERGFQGAYSFVALAGFAWMVLTFRAIPPEPLWWMPSDALWLAATVAMLLASVLFVGSLFGNPAFPGRPDTGAAPAPSGVFAITRHPMMWGFALWALVHAAVFPTASNAVLTAAILTLALVGAALQDRKKAMLQPGVWTQWQARTSYLPFAAQFAGKAPWTLGDTRALVGGATLWLIVTWAHVPLGGGMAAGIWRWIG
jgi:uncharacterized membrane protein